MAELSNILDCLEMAIEDGLATMEDYAEAYHEWYMCMEAISATEQVH
jgi:predicted RNA-binding protein associated with RNAse of E/G family